jgi:hypothetical protein
MEVLLILGGFCLLLAVYWIVRLNNQRKAKNERMRILNEEIMEAGRKSQQKRTLQKEQLSKLGANYGSPKPTPPQVVQGATYTVQQPAKSDDGFMDGVMMATVLNQMMHSDKDTISGTITKNLDTNEVTYKDSGPSYVDSSPKSSWSGPDTSSSWSSSDSSSSWSSSSSSSSSDSYSSPSSDW